MSPKRLGELLTDRGLIRAEDLQRGLTLQTAHGGRLGEALVRMGALSEAGLYETLSEQLGYPLLDIQALAPQAFADGGVGLSREGLLRHQALLWRDDSDMWVLGCADPLDVELRETVAASGLAVRWALVAQSLVAQWHGRLQAMRDAPAGLDAAALRELAEDAPVIAYVNTVLAQAVEARASDIHLEPGERQFALRFRVDGVLIDQSTVPMDRFAAVTSRIKLIAHMDIAERRLPQDGRVSVRAAGQEFDIRVSVIPAVHGESIVMRLLPKQRADLTLDRLGMNERQLAQFRRWLNWPNGLVLVTGPTGSGKSTTLYSALASITDSTRKLMTVEDPVEFRLPQVVQIQTQAEIGFTFARALRSILRHDPDVVMVGEIRDRETAEIAIQAALTGHLVLATLHTNDALSAVTRLTDMGVEPFLVAAALRATLAQRLVRTLCSQCALPSADAPPALEAAQLLKLANAGDLRWRQPVGCAHCNQTGFRGRQAIYELVAIGERLQHAIAGQQTLADLTHIANGEGRLSLLDDGLIKASMGLTTYDEVLRAAGTLDDGAA